MGCDERPVDGKAGPAPPQLKVVTTAYPLADVARRVGGKRVVVEWLRESGQGPETLEATPERRGQFRNADLVVTSGSAQGWTLEGADNAYSAQRIVRIDTLPSAQGLSGDAYLWLHPGLAKELAEALRARLAVLDSQYETFYRANTEQFVAEVDRVVADAGPTRRRLKGAPFASIDPGFAPLAAWAGMSPKRVADAPLRAMSDEVTRRLREALPGGSDASPRVFFAGADTPPAVIRELETLANARAVVLDALGTSAPSGRTTYGQVLRYNLEQLSAAAPPSTQSAATQPAP